MKAKLDVECKRGPTDVQNEYSGQSFEGIVPSLAKKFGKNACEKGTINITAKDTNLNQRQGQ
jgi:hypothetical protein